MPRSRKQLKRDRRELRRQVAQLEADLALAAAMTRTTAQALEQLAAEDR